MRPYVKSIYSNLKSPLPDGEAWNIELGPRTLFVGSNTSHKSGVIQSVELALAGSADDIFGRSAVSDAALLLTLAPNDELGVTATLSDDQVASFNARREDAKVKRPVHDGPGPNALVHRLVTSALSGSPASARKAFLSWSGGNVSLDDVLSYLPSDLQEKYKDISEYKGLGKSAVETLIDVAAYAGQKQREAAKEAKGAEIVLESLGDTIEAKPSEEDMTRMRMAVAEAKNVLDKSIRNPTNRKTRAELDAEIQAEENKIGHYEGQKISLQKEIDAVKATMPQLGDNVTLAAQIIEVAVNHNLDACPVCSSQVGLQHLKNCQSFYQKQESDWKVQVKSKLDVLNKKKDEIEFFDRQIVDSNYLLEKLRKTPAQVADSQAIPVSDAQSRLEAAMDALTKMDLSCSQWDNLSAARNKLMTMKGEVTTYKSLKSACEVAIGKLLNDQTRAFSDRVQKFLPAQWIFSIELLDGDREVFRMGIVRNGKLHAALSGAEWTSVVTAIAMAVSESLPSNHPAVLIPEDRAWDGKTLASVMRGFSNFDGQVIMASTTRPSGKTPKGWTIVDMDEVSASWTQEAEVVAEVMEEEKPVSKTSLNHASGGFRVTTRSALLLENLGWDPDLVHSMSRETVASIIKDRLLPAMVHVNTDGSYQIVRSGNVLPMPPAPKV